MPQLATLVVVVADGVIVLESLSVACCSAGRRVAALGGLGDKYGCRFFVVDDPQGSGCEGLS
jgi:hypothetical protein